MCILISPHLFFTARWATVQKSLTCCVIAAICIIFTTLHTYPTSFSTFLTHSKTSLQTSQLRRINFVKLQSGPFCSYCRILKTIWMDKNPFPRFTIWILSDLLTKKITLNSINFTAASAVIVMHRTENPNCAI